jgi:RNA 2',3'-cyclic 3'-phosphodiesterase
MAIRSFLAFELPSQIRETLSAVSAEGRAALRDMRWVRVANIHLTVVFMGNVEAAQMGPIKKTVEGVCDDHAPFRIQVSGIGTFGTRRNPRVLWMGLTGDGERMALFRDDLQKGLAPFGIQEEGRPFKPHLTLARFQKDAKAGPELGALLEEYQDMSGPEVILKELVLFKSDLKPGGAVYTPMGAWPLRG